MLQSAAALVSRASIGEWCLVVLGILLTIYIAGTWNYDYFKKRGILSSQPRIPFLGDDVSALLGLRPFSDIVKENYAKGAGHAVYGLFEFTKPSFMIRDPELIKIIAVKEFDNFMNHRTLQSDKTDPVFSKNLLNLKDQAWKDMRATLSPAFTTSKMKGMFPLISQCTEQMAYHLRQEYANSPEGSTNQRFPINMKDLFTRVATDVIATAAFGISCDSLKQPKNEFYEMGKILTSVSKLQILKFFGFLIFPKLMEMLGVTFLAPKAMTFFETLVQETTRERQRNGIYRPDMLQLLMQAREGQLKADDDSEAQDSAKRTELSDGDISAQAMIFFFAGFETISSALCVTMFVLSHHPEEMKRLRSDINNMMEETCRKPSYESVQKLKYLDCVINEALRMYPPAMATDRACKNDIQLPGGTNTPPFIVPKDRVVFIPIIGLHYDPDFWDEPKKFNPDRFSDENKHKIKPFTYMPFGVGPRVCIGQRLALMEVKLVLVHLLYNFDLHPSAKTKYPLEYEPGFNFMARGGFWCEITPRDI